MKKLKKILASIMAATVSAVSFCSILSSSAATAKYAAYTYYFDVPANTYVKICNANMSYNPSNTTFVRSSAGKLGGTFSVNDIGITSTSRKTYVEYSNSAPTGNAGNLGYVTVKTTSSAPTFSVTQVTNDRGNSLTTSSVTVSAILMGDVNLDGVVNEDDAVLLNKYCMNLVSFVEAQKRAADADGNGIVDSNDAYALLNYVNGNSDCVVV